MENEGGAGEENKTEPTKDIAEEGEMRAAVRGLMGLIQNNSTYRKTVKRHIRSATALLKRAGSPVLCTKTTGQLRRERRAARNQENT